MLHDLIELLSLLAGLEPVNPADRQKALQTRIDCACVIGAEELQSKIQESGPLLGEIVLENLLEEGNQLIADIGRSRGQGRDKSLPETGLFSFRNWRTLRAIFDGGPSAGNTVLQVNTSYKKERGQ
jgi:hypothetical protein